MKSLTILILCLVSHTSYSQINTGTVKKRAEQKVENRANQKVDQALDKGLDAIEGLFKKKKKTSEPKQESSSKTNAPSTTPTTSTNHTDNGENFVAVKNDFLGTVTMEYRFFKNEKEEKHSPLVIEMHLSPDATAMKMIYEKNPTSLFILHLDQNKITMVTDIENEGMAMEMKRPKLDKFTESKMKHGRIPSRDDLSF